MPGLKVVVMMLAVFFAILIGASGGVFLDRVLPNSGTVFGQASCFFGAFIYKPTFNVFGAELPIPVADDFMFGGGIALFLLGLFGRKLTLRKAAAWWVILTGVFIILYKILGILLLHIAEHWYGMDNCLTEITVGDIITIPWEWFDPLYVIPLAFLSVAILGFFYKLRNRGGEA